VYLASRPCLEALGRNGILSPIDVAMDEDEVAEGLSLGLVREILRLRGFDPARGGWYFKQIAILAYAQRFEAEERYLAWDADTVPLREADFVDDEGRTILERKIEYNAAYFRTMKSLLGIERQVEYSYIAEHMMFDRDIVRALIDAAMGGEAFEGGAFARRVMDSICEADFRGSCGFSEFETYGNFAKLRFPARISVRDSPSTREALNYFRLPPGGAQLFAMSGSYAWATFEAWTVSGDSLPARLKRSIRRTLGMLWTIAAAILHPVSCARFARIGRAVS
jgi:hypothetical protein